MPFKNILCVGAAAACLGGVLAPRLAAQAKPAAPAPAPAVSGPSKLAIINIQTTIGSTQEGKKSLAALQARFAPRNAQIQNDQKGLAALEKQLSDGGNTLSQDAKDRITAQIQAKQRDTQQEMQNFQSDLQDAQTDLMNTIGSKLMPLLKTYADQHGYTAVVDVSLPWPQGPVLYFNPGTNITGDMVKIYDQAYPAAAPGANR